MLLTHSEPTSVKQALKDTDWKAAMQHEYDALMPHQTWDLVPLPINMKAVDCK